MIRSPAVLVSSATPKATSAGATATTCHASAIEAIQKNPSTSARIEQRVSHNFVRCWLILRPQKHSSTTRERQQHSLSTNTVCDKSWVYRCEPQ